VTPSRSRADPHATAQAASLLPSINASGLTKIDKAPTPHFQRPSLIFKTVVHGAKIVLTFTVVIFGVIVCSVILLFGSLS
jgi:hypothetical protein